MVVCLPAVAENQPANKHRMNQLLSSFAARLREMMADRQSAIGNQQFSQLVLELFMLQFKYNSAYRKICETRKLTPQVVEHWTQIPAVPAAAFKELELACLAPGERTTVFHSSGTTEQKPSRHFHNAESLAVYEASLWTWFERRVLWSADGSFASCGEGTRGQAVRAPLLMLTPPPALVPHSSLVHMFEIVRQKTGAGESAFVGELASDGAWTLDFEATLAALGNNPQLILGTAFSFLHLLDYLAEKNLRFELPQESRVMETGGYKNRSRTMPKTELLTLITKRLGVTPDNIICEYGMSELSSQAYDGVRPSPGAAMSNMQASSEFRESSGASLLLRPGRAYTGSSVFHFPPWARVQIVSPETGREVAEGETGLIRIFDLANVFSIAAIQTEDLGIRRSDGFELIGRAQSAGPRGCSLMTA
jgi:Acyl-protein synthetase, LuxE